MSITTVGIIGLGAVGGSLALDLTARGMRVLGCDIDQANLTAAHHAGLLVAHWGFDPMPDVEALIIATPLHAIEVILETIRRSGVHYDLIMDVCSTKRSVVAAAERAQLEDTFVGAHPLAGSHLSGFAAARTGMFEDAKVFLCRTNGTSVSVLAAAETLWQSVGATCTRIDAADHDRHVAWSSHLPQLTASALALVLHAAGIPRVELGRGGRDMTRLAGSNAMMWRDIALTNADMLDEPLTCMIDVLEQLRSELRHRDRSGIEKLLRGSGEWHDA